jgi:hypothetical protein
LCDILCKKGVHIGMNLSLDDGLFKPSKNATNLVIIGLVICYGSYHNVVGDNYSKVMGGDSVYKHD